MAVVVLTHLPSDDSDRSSFLSFHFFFDSQSDMADFPVLLLHELSFRLLFVELVSLSRLRCYHASASQQNYLF
jgi:hypothetical protein